MQHQYLKLKNQLQTSILEGAFEPGDILPSENELKEKHGLSRFTVRRALDELEKEGFITKLHGKGSIVTNRKRKSLGIFSTKGFSSVAELEGTVKNKFLKKPYFVKWGKDFFYELTPTEIQHGATCYERLRSVGKDPVMLEYTYIPNEGFPVINKDE